jgi:hypothetical protein
MFERRCETRRVHREVSKRGAEDRGGWHCWHGCRVTGRRGAMFSVSKFWNHARRMARRYRSSYSVSHTVTGALECAAAARRMATGRESKGWPDAVPEIGAKWCLYQQQGGWRPCTSTVLGVGPGLMRLLWPLVCLVAMPWHALMPHSYGVQ